MHVNANSDEIIRFANQLQDYIEHLQDETSSISSAYNQLGNEWSDGKYAELGEALNELRSQMQAFCEKAQDQIPHLRNMADKLQEYEQS